ncbi:hypothetical protein MHBO_001290, partial [Bonamia ostreae]
FNQNKIFTAFAFVYSIDNDTKSINLLKSEKITFKVQKNELKKEIFIKTNKNKLIFELLFEDFIGRDKKLQILNKFSPTVLTRKICPINANLQEKSKTFCSINSKTKKITEHFETVKNFKIEKCKIGNYKNSFSPFAKSINNLKVRNKNLNKMATFKQQNNFTQNNFLLIDKKEELKLSKNTKRVELKVIRNIVENSEDLPKIRRIRKKGNFRKFVNEIGFGMDKRKFEDKENIDPGMNVAAKKPIFDYRK